MRCPYCNYADSRVADSRPDLETSTIRRRRVCNQCGAKFTTVERIQMRDLVVRKNSGKTEPFDREKLRRSIKLACHNRDVGDEQIDRLVASIQRRLETENVDDMVTSAQVGQMVSDSPTLLPSVTRRVCSEYAASCRSRRRSAYRWICLPVT